MEQATTTKHHSLNAFTFSIRTKGWQMLTMTIETGEWRGRTERDSKGRVIVYQDKAFAAVSGNKRKCTRPTSN
jgi:hypothetical protein